MNRFFIGNIVQTVWEEDENRSNGIISVGDVHPYIIKENAILYKTENGSYVDVEELKNERDYKSVDKTILESNSAIESKKDFLILPEKSLSKLMELNANAQGLFVNSDTLKKYNLDVSIKCPKLLNIK